MYVLERTVSAGGSIGRKKGEHEGDIDVRERIARDGPAALADRDLVVAMLGSGCAGRPVSRVAQEVLAAIDSSNGSLRIGEVRNLTGMGDAKACAIVSALELGRRLFGPRGKRITMPGEIYPLIVHLADRKQEHFLVLSLNGAHEVVGLRSVTSGLVNRTMIHPREVYADPLTDRACAIVVAHNHPSGNLEPSKEDIEITQKLVRAGDTLGIPLLDHLVFCATGYYSFVEHGIIAPTNAD